MPAFEKAVRLAVLEIEAPAKRTFGLQTVESKISCFDPPHLSPCSSYRNNFFPSFDFQAIVITGVDG
ncbi:hypothetical protein TNCV_3491711 [Trichonephila clavipes]|nr:hypothetical protein TNCV_3491711 [Trichonephila clavipes]